jgi:hypothetical protein
MITDNGLSKLLALCEQWNDMQLVTDKCGDINSKLVDNLNSSPLKICTIIIIIIKVQTNSVGFSPQANYTD